MDKQSYKQYLLSEMNKNILFGNILEGRDNDPEFIDQGGNQWSPVPRKPFVWNWRDLLSNTGGGNGGDNGGGNGNGGSEGPTPPDSGDGWNFQNGQTPPLPPGDSVRPGHPGFEWVEVPQGSGEYFIRDLETGRWYQNSHFDPTVNQIWPAHLWPLPIPGSNPPVYPINVGQAWWPFLRIPGVDRGWMDQTPSLDGDLTFDEWLHDLYEFGKAIYGIDDQGYIKWPLDHPLRFVNPSPGGGWLLRLGTSSSPNLYETSSNAFLSWMLGWGIDTDILQHWLHDIPKGRLFPDVMGEIGRNPSQDPWWHWRNWPGRRPRISNN